MAKQYHEGLNSFRLILQAADNNGFGGIGKRRETRWVGDDSRDGWSDWAFDSDRFDPDVLTIGLEIQENVPLERLDFRLGIQAVDEKGNAQRGPVQYTPWASEGGSWSKVAYDTNQVRPDGFRVHLEHRPWPNNAKVKKINDFCVGICVYSKKGQTNGKIQRTPWMSQKGGDSRWARISPTHEDNAENRKSIIDDIFDTITEPIWEDEPVPDRTKFAPSIDGVKVELRMLYEK